MADNLYYYANAGKAKIRVMTFGIRVECDGDLNIEAEDNFLAVSGTKLQVTAKQYIWVYSGESGLLLMPDQIQVSAPDLYLCSPQNYIYQVLDEEALFEYFVNNVVDKDPDYTYNDPNHPLATAYEAWLDDVYGRTEMGKFWDYMETLDGIQDALDVIGLVWDGADVINFIISVCRMDWERAAWSFVGMLPLAGSLIARAGRAATRTSKVAMEAANAVSGGRTVVKELERTIGSLGELKQYERLTLDILEDLKEARKPLSELPAGFKTEKVCLQLADGNYVGINVIVRYGDNVADALGDARRTEKVVDGTLGGGRKSAQDIISERVQGFDLTEHPTNYRQLSSKRMKELKSKIDNRTATREEYELYDWNRRLANRRNKGVSNFWDQERERILSGKPTTRNWTEQQINDILNYKTPTYNGQPIVGHHTYSVSKYPHLADKGEVIYPATFNEHINGWHGGNYKKSLPGKPFIDIEDF